MCNPPKSLLRCHHQCLLIGESLTRKSLGVSIIVFMVDKQFGFIEDRMQPQANKIAKQPRFPKYATEDGESCLRGVGVPLQVSRKAKNQPCKMARTPSTLFSTKFHNPSSVPPVPSLENRTLSESTSAYAASLLLCIDAGHTSV
uniref:Uncharacterized protein n=1 Tax=Coccidioides posadasii RMSCC 3488 TaxID=454284 RepID=A0A0J6FE91_COCPO|nr:hypothetical protein CPAG_04929 [Coccidioides posadasii RMSCC 3488]